MQQTWQAQEQRDELVRELTRRTAAGSEVAFAEFYQLIFDKLFRLLLVQTNGNEELSKEIVQLVLLRVVKYIQPFENERVLWAWLRQVARSCHIDLLRKSNSRPPTVSLDLFTETLCSASGDDNAELLSALDKSMTRLDAQEREVLHLSYFEGVPHRDIAAKLDITAKAVESKLARIREKLKRLLVQTLKEHALF